MSDDIGSTLAEIAMMAKEPWPQSGGRPL